MTTALLLVGLTATFLLYRIFQYLADIYDLLASLYVFRNLDGERDVRTQEAKKAASVVENKGIFFNSPQRASSILNDFRLEIEAHFHDLRCQLAAKKKE